MQGPIGLDGPKGEPVSKFWRNVRSSMCPSACAWCWNVVKLAFTSNFDFLHLQRVNPCSVSAIFWKQLQITRSIWFNHQWLVLCPNIHGWRVDIWIIKVAFIWILFFKLTHHWTDCSVYSTSILLNGGGAYGERLDLIEKGRPGDKGQKGDASTAGIDVLSAVKVIKFYASNDMYSQTLIHPTHALINHESNGHVLTTRFAPTYGHPFTHKWTRCQ